jgi:hypothetical protein
MAGGFYNGIASIAVSEAGDVVLPFALELDFIGATIARGTGEDAQKAIVTITGAGSTINLEDDGSPVAGGPFSTLNIIGADSIADGGGGTVDVTLPSGGSLDVQSRGVSTVDPATALNFSESFVITDEGSGVAGIDLEISVSDDGVLIGDFQDFDFTGTGVTVSDQGSGVVEVDIPGLAVEDDGSAVADPVTTLNFIGATVTDQGGGQVDVEFSGSGNIGDDTTLTFAANETGLNGNQIPLAWDTTTRNELAMSIAGGVMTVPAGLDGAKLQLFACIRAINLGTSNILGLVPRLNGSDMPNGGAFQGVPGATIGGYCICSAPFIVASGDTIDVQVVCNDTSYDIQAALSYFSVVRLA